MRKGVIKKGGSGLYLNANDKDAFEHFLNNSTARFLGTGSFGMTYALTLNPGIESKYLSLDASTYGMKVRQILLKTIFIYPLEVELSIELRDGTKETKKTTTIDNFYEEVNTQTDVYLKTMQYLEPLCPAIVYANVINEDTDMLMRKVQHIMSSGITPGSVQKLRDYNGIGIGLIGMEIMGNAQTLNNYVERKLWYESYIAKAYHTLIEFIIKTGYSHGDFHGGNFLVNSSIKNYFWGKTGKVTIIDFGFTEKLSQEKYNKIKTLYNEKKYVDILKFLCDIPRKDGYVMDDFEGYTLMCLKSQPELVDAPGYIVNLQEMNNKIAELYSLREESINNLIRTFTQKHLPLSNTAKNEMYNGVHFDIKFINGFERIIPINKMDEQVKQILDSTGFSYTSVKLFRLQVKSCYMLVYLLNNNFTDRLDTRFAAMIYAGVFNGIEDIYVFRMAARYVNANALRSTIKSARILEGVRFNNFLDYFNDEQLAKVTEAQISHVLNTNLWQEQPERAAIALKVAANISITNRPKKEFDVRQGFQELPFAEPLEDISIEESTVSVINNNRTDGFNHPDGLPRPSFLPFQEPGFQKKKLTAGKRHKTKRKQNKRKGLSRKK